MSVYCSPAIDIGYISAITKYDETNGFPEEEIILFYHEEFVKALRAFGYLKSPPTLLDLNVEILKYSQASMLIQIVFFPLLFGDDVDADELVVPDDKEKSFELRKKILNSPKCEKMFKKLLKSWRQKGYLEGKRE